ncbi:MAG: hypothetical protein HN955_08500 [Prolixibacteraceae bacterium]|nr:hypothetical protein [Prolixibacteraceae bacterium]MBT6998474.1 hypothetical protein [Prolixibacteraceae bacterium]
MMLSKTLSGWVAPTTRTLNYTDLTIKCRMLSFYSAYSFVVVSALTIINFEIAMRHFKVQLVLLA